MVSFKPFCLSILFAISGVLKADDSALCKLEDDVCIGKLMNKITDEVAAGIPALNIEPADPMFFDFVEGKLNIVDYKLVNSTIKGYSLCEFKISKVKLNESSLHLEIVCPEKTLINGKYEVDSKLKNWEVKRQGIYEFRLGAFNVNIDAVLRMIQREDGKIFLKIKDFIAKFKVMSPVEAKFNNEVTGENSVSLYDRNNWQGFAEILQEPLMMTSLKRIFRDTNSYLKTLLFDKSESYN